MPRTTPATDDARGRDGAPPHRRRRSAGPATAFPSSGAARAVDEAPRAPADREAHRWTSAAHRAADPGEATDGVVDRPGVADAARPVLSPAEQRVAALLGTDLTFAEIGTRLFLTRNTVKSHVRRIYRRLGVHDRQSAVACLRAGDRPAAEGAAAPGADAQPLVLARDRAPGRPR